MEHYINNKLWKIILIVFTVLTGIFCLFFYFYTISLPFVIGFVMILITKRLVNSYEFKGNTIKKYLSISAIIGFWVIAIFFMFQYTKTELSSLSNDYDYPKTEISEKIKNTINSYLHPEELEGGTNFLHFLISSKRFEHFIENLNHIIINCILIIPLLFVYYFYKSKDFVKYIFKYVKIEKLLSSIAKDLEDYFMNKIRMANAIALFSGIGYFIIGLKGAFLFGILTGAFYLIPHIGFGLSTLIVTIIAGLQGPINLVRLSDGTLKNLDNLFFLAINTPERIFLVLIIQVFIFLLSKIYLKKCFITKNMHLDPLLEIVLVLVAAKLIGVMGMFFIIPIFYIYKVIFEEIIKTGSTNT